MIAAVYRDVLEKKWCRIIVVGWFLCFIISLTIKIFQNIPVLRIETRYF